MDSAKLIPIKYHKREYPRDIHPRIQEIAGHFDKFNIQPTMKYSLHTEYSAYKRKLDSDLLQKYSTIRNSHNNGIPKLWYNEKWSIEFYEFLKKIINGNHDPTIIEIHPPFNDYISSIEDFIKHYTLFEERMIQDFPQTHIVIENRFGTVYRNGKFLISKTEDLLKLTDLINKHDLKLRIVLDFPQLFSANGLSIGYFPEDKLISIIEPLKSIRSYIEGIHIWGKIKSFKGNTISHVGSLDSYFDNPDIKKIFFNLIFDLLHDGKVRYFVPEVNSNNDDLSDIVNDFISNGFEFIE